MNSMFIFLNFYQINLKLCLIFSLSVSDFIREVCWSEITTIRKIPAMF